MDEKEAEARPLMGTIFLVKIHRWFLLVKNFFPGLDEKNVYIFT